jgi:hypothetical protein
MSGVRSGRDEDMKKEETIASGIQHHSKQSSISDFTI